MTHMLKTPFQQLPTENPSAFQNALIDWFKEEGRTYPWRETTEPYPILVSEIMLQQTQIATVLQRGYYDRWLTRFPDLESLAAAPENELLSTWEGLGYYNRARNLQKLAKCLIADHGGKFPTTAEALRQLPGIGPYTAGAVASFAYNESAALVDGNVARVFARLFDYSEPINKPPGNRQLWQWAEELVSPDDARSYNSALMELGQRICRKGQPDCLKCPVARFCSTPDPGTLPIKEGKTKLTEISESAIWNLKDGRVLLHHEQGKRRKGLWKLPLRPHDEVEKSKLVYQGKYGITRYKVTLQVFEANSEPQADDHWIELSELPELPMATPFRRAMDELLKTHPS